MKKILIALICVAAMTACKKSASAANNPQKMYFRIEAVDNDGNSTVTSYKLITVS